MQRQTGFILALVAMTTVGGAVTAAGFLGDYPIFSAQAVRYALAASVLLLVGRASTRWPVRVPRGREWLWLFGAATFGQSVYNVAVVVGLRHAEPSVIATMVAAVPIVLAIGAPLLARRRPPLGVVAAAALVAIGSIVVIGGGAASALGVVLAIVALAGESGFTLLSIPVLGRLGGLSVALHTSWIAAVQLAVVGVIADGSGVFTRPDLGVVMAIVYLIGASTLAFSFWFIAVEHIGADIAGLAAGVIPPAAVLTGLPFGLTTLDTPTVVGTAMVTIGIVAGLRAAARSEIVESYPSPSTDPSSTEPLTAPTAIV